MQTNVYLQTVKDWRKPFFTIWTGQAFSLFGSTIVQFAIIWWLTRESGSAMVLAVANVVGAAPEFFLGPFVGALVDRWDRRLVMIFADVFIALATFGLAILFWFDLVQIWHIYVILFIRSLGSCFHWPAMMATTSLMVPDKHLSRISGINQALRGGMTIVGPPLGAILLGAIPFYGIISIDVLTAIFAIVSLLFVFIPQPEKLIKKEIISFRLLLNDIKIAGKYVVSWPGLFGVLILAVLLNSLVSPAFVMLPILVTEHFLGGAWHLGAIESAEGFGIIAGGLLMGVWGGFKKRIVSAMAGTIGMGVGLLMVGITPQSLFWLALGALFICGLTNTIQNANFFSIVQAKVSPEIQGRVFTLFQSLIVGILMPAYLVSGKVADWLGIQTFYFIAGFSAIIGGVVALFIPAIMSIEENAVENAISDDENKKDFIPENMG